MKNNIYLLLWADSLLPFCFNVSVDFFVLFCSVVTTLEPLYYKGGKPPTSSMLKASFCKYEGGEMLSEELIAQGYMTN